MVSVSAKTLEGGTTEIGSGSCRVATAWIKIQTADRVELHNLTQQVQDFVRSSGVHTGQVIVASMHTTSAVFINEWQDALLFDIRQHIESTVTREGYYRHNDPKWSDCDRNNADSHLRALVLGTQVALPVAESEVVLGEFQSVIMGELDGPRERTILLQVMGINND